MLRRRRRYSRPSSRGSPAGGPVNWPALRELTPGPQNPDSSTPRSALPCPPVRSMNAPAPRSSLSNHRPDWAHFGHSSAQTEAVSTNYEYVIPQLVVGSTSRPDSVQQFNPDRALKRPTGIRAGQRGLRANQPRACIAAISAGRPTHQASSCRSPTGFGPVGPARVVLPDLVN
jgi:hypothetical protein